MRKCTSCEEDKPESEFYGRSDGNLRKQCKFCESTRNNKRSQDRRRGIAAIHDKNQRTLESGEVVKKCTKCGDEKPLDRFYKRSGYDSLYAHCKDCHYELTRERSEVPKIRSIRSQRVRAARAVDPVLAREKYLAAKYKIPIERVRQIRSSPCSMCGRPDSGIADKAMCIDHCHATDVVRGGLCHNCNIYVGFREKNKHLEEAYERHVNGPY